MLEMVHISVRFARLHPRQQVTHARLQMCPIEGVNAIVTACV